MNYTGKLYGRIGSNEYFDTGKTSEYWDQLEDNNKKHKYRRLASIRLSLELRSENKDLTRSLEKIIDLTSDEELPLLKAINQIAHKTLK